MQKEDEMEKDETMSRIIEGDSLSLSRVRSSIEAKDVGIVGIALFICLMVACALFFS